METAKLKMLAKQLSKAIESLISCDLTILDINKPGQAEFVMSRTYTIQNDLSELIQDVEEVSAKIKSFSSQ